MNELKYPHNMIRKEFLLLKYSIDEYINEHINIVTWVKVRKIVMLPLTNQINTNVGQEIKRQLWPL